jgi:cystathionine beta-lyase/cystathionine gamma-synthase
VLASITQTPGLNSQADFGVSARAIRLSIGHEDTQDLWQDLSGALQTARR